MLSMQDLREHFLKETPGRKMLDITSSPTDQFTPCACSYSHCRGFPGKYLELMRFSTYWV